VPVAKRVLRKEGPPLRLVELRRSYLLWICARRPYDQRGGIFSKIRENVYGFAQKVPSASEPKPHDNACPHTARKTLQKIEEVEGIELLPHPAFSPDLEPSDYYLFRSMAQFL
jgi:hypothetical protein